MANAPALLLKTAVVAEDDIIGHAITKWPKHSVVEPQVEPEVPSLTLKSAHVLMPHPLKAFRGGEDVQITVNVGGHTLIGVFDGVGGWADLGVDPAMYPREMARIIETEMLRNTGLCDHDERPLSVLLQLAYNELNLREVHGSCTACLALMTSSGQLHVLNIGDSGLHVIRDGISVFCTNEQQHYFNCPFQLGMGSDDTPSDADYYVLEDVADGDLLVVATDGVWDNVYEEDMLQIVAQSNEEPEKIAWALSELSHKHGSDQQYLSPFAANAARKGLTFTGGKLDDVTVVASRVTNVPKGMGGGSKKFVKELELVEKDDELGSPISSLESNESQE